MISLFPVLGRALACAAGLLALLAPAQAQQAPAKELRTAFLIAESGFDPAQVTDLYSNTVVVGIFEAPLEYAFLAKPVRMRPNTAAAMPEVSADFRTFTFRIRPGIHFADDPAFQGRRRELVAEDYVYAIKRHYDPRWKSGKLYLFQNAKILGLSELRTRLLNEKKPFEYDTPVEGLRALDRYTFEVKLAESNPRFLQVFTDGSLTGAVAREVVEFYGDKIGEHPVGTGPFKLGEWRRSARIVLEKNPGYREVFYDEEAPPGDARLAADAAKLKGRRLPLVDRVAIAIIEEPQPRYLAFLNEEHDTLERLPNDFAEKVVPNGRLSADLAKRGIVLDRYLRADVSVSYFAMEHPVVGGYEPHKVALRRAISLAVDLEREIRLTRRNQAIPAQGVIAPQTWPYDPAFKSEMSQFSLARAKALLDMHGYVDRDGDGWRDQPDGSALVLNYATSPDQEMRQLAEQWKRNMDALGVRIEFNVAKWPEHLKASRAGKLMMWGVGWSAGAPDADTFLSLGYGPNKGQANHARFDLPAYNALYEKQRAMPDGPERKAVMYQANRMLVAWMPYKVHVHRYFTDLAHPWVVGYHRNLFVREFFKYVDVDTDEQRRRRRAS
ncbi:MAG: bicyclomycin resistance protein [Rubrivivax sp.]|nr:bicyclomycin resistance protein [Rubrivivax sp.]